MYYIDVAPSRPLVDPLTYIYDSSLPIGTRVEIPIGKTNCFGFVINCGTVRPKDFEPKNIIKVCGENPYFDSKNLEFYKWVSDYYHYPLGETLSLITPSFIPKKKIKVLDDTTEVLRRDPFVDLTEDQQNVLALIRDEKDQKKFESKTLLHGVTGCGKTEVYIELAKDTIAKGKGALIIVPEIALTPQLVNRISCHFKGNISVLHSGISPKKRYQTWLELLTGKSLLCIGARSAIFAPMPNIGLIVVDEEQDSSYKQDDRLRYNARDLSFVLGKMFDAKVVLASATPSLDTLYTAKNGRCKYVYIKNRVRGLCLPPTIMVDLKKAKMASQHLSEELVKNIKETVEKKQQVILYINRRGFAHTIMCGECGKSITCSKCSITMTEHKRKGVLLCHYCGDERALPNYCSFCGSHQLHSLGSGTERIYSEIKQILPDARIAIMDSDQMSGKNKLQEMLSKIEKKELDIIVGTQILGKGHDFPDVTMVGIINTDTMLQLPDFRSAERAFQQIMQVSGRAGRMCSGVVVVQSYLPEHFAVKTAVRNDYDGFYNEEIEQRKDAFYPPFSFLIDLKFSASSKKEVEQEAKKVSVDILNLIKGNKIDAVVLGPSPSPISMINKKFRYHVLIKGKSRGQLNKLLKIFNTSYKRKSKIKFNIDVDPNTLF